MNIRRSSMNKNSEETLLRCNEGDFFNAMTSESEEGNGNKTTMSSD